MDAQELPALTGPVNDFANAIDSTHEAAIEELIRSLQQASGDVVVVATIDTFAPYGDLREYAVKLFENGGRGIGQRGRDNGLLLVVAVTDRQVWIEVGYDLEQFVTDGFAGETSRQFMAPEFRRGAYGAGVLAGVSRLIARIAERRNVTIQGVRPGPTTRAPWAGSSSAKLLVALLVFFAVINAIVGRTAIGRTHSSRGFRRQWGKTPGGWHSGAGPFGGGFGGFGGGGGGFGGGFGGFGGGRSGGGGGGAGW